MSEKKREKISWKDKRGISSHKVLSVIGLVIIILISYGAWQYVQQPQSGGTSNEEPSPLPKGSLEIHTYEGSTEAEANYSLTDSTGELIASGTTPATLSNLKTGTYTVSVTYGAKGEGKTVRVLENQTENVSFTFQKTFSNLVESVPLTEDPAPHICVTDMNGTLFDLSEYEGRVIAVHFMLVYCGGGIDYFNEDQLRELKVVCNEHHAKDLVVVTLALQFCEHRYLAGLRNAYDVTWFLGRDEEMNILNDYCKYFAAVGWKKGDGTMVLIDKKSHVRYLCWHIDASRLSNRISELMTESG